jgi:ParB-like chromosome segregation protein Spo0J
MPVKVIRDTQGRLVVVDGQHRVMVAAASAVTKDKK